MSVYYVPGRELDSWDEWNKMPLPLGSRVPGSYGMGCVRTRNGTGGREPSRVAFHPGWN